MEERGRRGKVPGLGVAEGIRKEQGGKGRDLHGVVGIVSASHEGWPARAGAVQTTEQKQALMGIMPGKSTKGHRGLISAQLWCFQAYYQPKGLCVFYWGTKWSKVD